jgi:hypothetical protein
VLYVAERKGPVAALWFVSRIVEVSAEEGGMPVWLSLVPFALHQETKNIPEVAEILASVFGE